MTFEKIFDNTRIDDDFVKLICSKKFYIYFVSIEDQKVKDTLLLHYSSIIMEKNDIKVLFMTHINI